MSVSSQVPYKKYTATAGATLFSTGFRLILASDLIVKVNGVVVTTGFTVSSLGVGAGSDVTFGTPMAGGEIIELIRSVPKTRLTDYQQLGDYQAESVNNDFDRLVMMLQDSQFFNDLAILLPVGDTAAPMTLPAVSERALKFLAFDLDGKAIATAGAAGTPVSTFMAAVLLAANAAAARSGIGAGTGDAQAGDNTDIKSLGNNTSTIYTTAGTSTAYTITPNPAITAYAIGQSHMVNFNAASGASPTLQISGIATPPNLIKRLPDGTYGNIGANDIQAGHRSRVTLISTTQALVEELNPLPSMLMVRTPPAGAAGYGTTNTRFRRFTIVDVNQGSGFTYADSVTLGGLITTTEPGTWAISYTDQFAAGDYLSITLNDTVPTGAPLAAEVLASGSAPSANLSCSCSWEGYLPAGSLIRARAQNGASSGTQTQYGQFTISRVG